MERNNELQEKLITLVKNLQTKLNINHFELEFLKEDDSGVKMENITGFFSYKENWSDKIGRVASLLAVNGSGLDILSILSPKNEGESSNYHKVAMLNFRGDNFFGQTELINEIKDNTVVTRFLTLTTFHLSTSKGKKSIIEIATSWEQGIKLTAMSINDFKRNPEKFIAERIMEQAFQN